MSEILIFLLIFFNFSTPGHTPKSNAPLQPWHVREDFQNQENVKVGYFFFFYNFF